MSNTSMVSPPEIIAGQWDFDALGSGITLDVLGVALFNHYDLLSTLGLRETELRIFFALLRSKYAESNPYHRHEHAVDVLAAAHFLLSNCSDHLRESITPVEIAAFLIAAAGHDAGHFALNNAYLRNNMMKAGRVDTPRAVAPLEHFHAKIIISMLRGEALPEAPLDVNGASRHLNGNSANRSGVSLLRNMTLVSEVDRERLVSLVETLVHSTNMEMHKSCFAALTEYVSRGGPSGPPPPLSSADEHLLLLTSLLKAADLSNVVRPLWMADMWAERILEEFYAQGSREHSEGLPVTTTTDTSNHEIRLCEHQVGFLKAVVRPLFDATLRFCEEDARDLVIKHACANEADWDRRIREIKARDASQDASAKKYLESETPVVEKKG